MVSLFLISLISVLLVSAISLVGIIALYIRTEKLSKFLLYLVSFAAGGLIGDVFIHLLPEIVEEAGSFTLSISLFILLGVVVFFILEKLVHWHHYHLPHTKSETHPFAITNLIGDGFHNLIDGIIIGASYLVSIPVGIATTVAVIVHEIPQEIGDFGVLLQAGYTKKKALIANFITALTAIIGVIIAFLLSSIEGITAILIPFAAGGFIYIAGADLIPELHKEFGIRKSIGQLFAFLAGIGVMLLLILLE